MYGSVPIGGCFREPSEPVTAVFPQAIEPGPLRMSSIVARGEQASQCFANIRTDGQVRRSIHSEFGRLNVNLDNLSLFRQYPSQSQAKVDSLPQDQDQIG